MTTQPAPDQALSGNITYDIAKNRGRILQFMQQTHDTLRHILFGISQERATTLRDAHDGDKGWTVLEVLCHLCDYDNIFRKRAQLMAAQKYPTLPAPDHIKMVEEGNYNGQELAQVIEEFSHSRRQTIAFFAELSDDHWQRAGLHPERGHFTMLDAALQIGLHDTIHLEQITRILFDNH